MSLNQTEIQPPKLNHQSPFRKRKWKKEIYDKRKNVFV